MKEYTLTTMVRRNNTETAIAYYWEDGKRKSDHFINKSFYLYVPEDEEVPNQYSVTTGFTNVYGEKVKKVDPRRYLEASEFVKFRDQFHKTYESDFTAFDRWMCEKKPKFTHNVRLWYLDIEVGRDENGQYSSAQEAGNKILSITIYDTMLKKYIVLALTPDNRVGKYEEDNVRIILFNSEIDMINEFVTGVKFLDPDYITGWNVIDFDMAYIVNRMKRIHIDARQLSPVFSVRAPSFSSGYGNKFSSRGKVIIKGRGLFDMMEGARQLWLGTDVGYSLDAISKKYLGKGKVDVGDIDKVWKNNFQLFLDYAIEDVKLCVELEEKVQIIKTFQEFQSILSINLFDTPIASKLIYYSVKQYTDIVLDNGNKKPVRDYPGGYVFPVKKGIYKNTWKYDYTSMYPTQILTLNISPDSIVWDPENYDKKDLIHFKCWWKWETKGSAKPRGVYVMNPKESEKKNLEYFDIYFHKHKKGIITKLEEKFFLLRLEEKAVGNKKRSTVIKRLVNSFYGLLAYIYSRMFSMECAMAVTLASQRLNMEVAKRIESKGMGKVIMGDTDSFCITPIGKIGTDEIVLEADTVFNELSKEYNADKCWYDLELEYVIDKMVIFDAKKKYAQFIKGKYDIKGLEMIKKDCPGALKDFQKSCLDYIFTTEKPGLTKIKEIREQITEKALIAIKDKNYKYVGIPSVVKKPLPQYQPGYFPRKALENSGLKISMNETFYIVIGVDGKPYAFKDNTDEFLQNLTVDTWATVERLFSNKSLFENLFIKQMSIGDW